MRTTLTRSTSRGRGMAGLGWSPTRISKAPTASSTRTFRRTKPGCSGCSSSSRSPAAFRAMLRPRRPVPSTKAASLGILCCTLMARCSTTRICWHAALSVMAKSETGPLAASWHSNKFLNPVRDGAVLPILHLNGYKIAGPTVLARIPEDELRQLLTGYGYRAGIRRLAMSRRDASAHGAHA